MTDVQYTIDNLESPEVTIQVSEPTNTVHSQQGHSLMAKAKKLIGVDSPESVQDFVEQQVESFDSPETDQVTNENQTPEQFFLSIASDPNKSSQMRTLATMLMSNACPVVLSGEPGTAKTATLSSLFEKMYVLYGSSVNPEDVHGIVTDAGDSLRRKPMTWVTELNQAAEQGKRVALFVDELNHLSQEGQSAMMRIFGERFIGDVRLNQNIRLIGAMNSVDHGGGDYHNMALQNRTAVLEWQPDFDAWMQWLGAKSHFHHFVVNFFKGNSRIIHQVPKNPNEVQKWPSMRSWDRAIESIRPLMESGAANDDIVYKILVGTVGDAAAKEFMTWKKQNDLVDPEDVISGKKALWLNPTRDDVNRTILNGLVDRVQQKFSEDRFYRVMDIFQSVLQDKGLKKGDIILMPIRDLIQIQAKNAAKFKDKSMAMKYKAIFLELNKYLNSTRKI